MNELIDLIKAWNASYGETLKTVVTIMAILGISVDLTPWVKVQPVRALFRWIGKLLGKLCKKLGKAFNGELYEKIDKMNEHIDNIDVRIDGLEKRFDESEARAMKYRMTSLHDRIFQMHRFFMSRGKIGYRDLQNFKLCVEEYKENGGDGLVDDKIEPEVLSLQIDYSEPEMFDETKAEKI